MALSLAEIAASTGLVLEGAGEIVIEGVAEAGRAGPGRLALGMSPDYAEALRADAAEAAVLWPGADWQALGLRGALFAPRARVALAAIGEVFAPAPDMPEGIHPTAIVDPSAEIGADVWIGPFSWIGPGARIGAGGRIGPHATVGGGATLGPGALLHSGVRIGARVTIGARFIAQPNAVIGGDGFSYVTPERGAVESAKETGEVAADARNTGLRRIASLGAVTLGDDVEVGACATIDRGTVVDTRIGDGTKIDNQVMIGHNCVIGSLCLLCGQVGLAGSVTVGDRVVLGGQVGVGDHLKIGSDSVLAGGSLVGANVKPGSVLMGAPAAPREQVYAQVMAVKRLPKLMEQMREIRAKLGL